MFDPETLYEVVGTHKFTTLTTLGVKGKDGEVISIACLLVPDKERPPRIVFVNLSTDPPQKLPIDDAFLRRDADTKASELFDYLLDMLYLTESDEEFEDSSECVNSN